MADTKLEMTLEEQAFSFLVEDMYAVGGKGFIAAGTIQMGSINTEEVYTLRVTRTQRLVQTRNLLLRRHPGDPIRSAPHAAGIGIDLHLSANAIVKGDLLTMVKP